MSFLHGSNDFRDGCSFETPCVNQGSSQITRVVSPSPPPFQHTLSDPLLRISFNPVQHPSTLKTKVYRVIQEQWGDMPTPWITQQLRIYGMLKHLWKTVMDDTGFVPRSRWTEHLPSRNAPNYEFCVLVLMLLTPSTTDQQVIANTIGVFTENFTPENIVIIGVAAVEKLFSRSGRYKNNARHIWKISNVILRRYNGQIPESFEQLCELSGVGPKIALITIQTAFLRTDGIGIDRHMIKIFNKLGWTDGTDSEHVRIQLQMWLPLPYWPDTNEIIAGTGQIMGIEEKRAKYIALSRKLGTDYSELADTIAGLYMKRLE